MIRRAQVVELEDDHFAAGDGDVPVGGEPADAVVHGRRRGRVVHVHVRVREESGVEGDAEQTPFPGGVDSECKKWSRQKRSVLDHAQPAALLADEETSVGRELHGGWTRQAARDHGFGEPRRQRCGSSRSGKSEVEKDRKAAVTVGSTTSLHFHPTLRVAA